jgi:cytochrome P450
MSETLAERPDAGAPPLFPMDRGGCPFVLPTPLTELREHDPISRVRIWDGSTPWLVTRHADARAVLADPRFSIDFGKPGYPPVGPGRLVRLKQRRSFVSMDDPEHARFRKMLIPYFTARHTESLRPMVTEVVGELLDRMAAGPRPVDLVEAFALPLPSMVICRMLGVPYIDHAFFHHITATQLSNRTPSDVAEAAGIELIEYLHHLVRAKITDPGDDLISRLVLQRLRTGELDEDQLVGMINVLLVAGHETTANQLALGTLMLLGNPRQAAQLRESDDPALAVSAAEELLRLVNVAHSGRRRVATEDVEIGGVRIRAGDGVIVTSDTANSDPRMFDGPDELDLHRKARNHLSFGFGTHQCLGAPLARLELQVAYPALLRRFRDLAVAVEVEDLRFRGDMLIYQVRELPVTW